MFTHFNTSDFVIFLTIVRDVPNVHNLNLKIFIFSKSSNMVGLFLGEGNTSGFDSIFSGGMVHEGSPSTS